MAALHEHDKHAFFLPDEAALSAFGSAWAAHLQAPLLVCLNGDLGAGKTTFVRGILRGLGYTGAVKSPTYTLVETYRLPETAVNHFDLYRFQSPEEWQDAGLDDLFTEHALNFIEWAKLGGDYVPDADVLIQFTHHENGRLLHFDAQTPAGQNCLTALPNNIGGDVV